MKSQFFLVSAATVLICSACLAPMDQAKRISFLGDPASVLSATRTVNIDQNTRYVVITGGEIIQFNVGDKSFAWRFDGAGQYNFDLMLVAPQGMLDHRVMAYVKPDPNLNGGR